MFDRMAGIINFNKAKLREIFHNKYLWGFAGVLLLVLVTVMLLQPGQKKHFQTAHQELTELAGNIRNHYKVRPDYWGLDTASALKNKLVPVSMLHHDKVISAIGREVILGQDADGNMVMPGQRNFMITIPNLSKTACVAMLSHPFKKEEHVVVQAVEPIVAGADMSDISKEDAQVNTMLELSKQFQKGVK